MRFPPLTDANGYDTLAVEDAHGPQDHGFSDGSVVLWDEALGTAGNATRVAARVFTDLVLNTKYACREGNGARGPESGAVNDNPYELAAAVNRAASPLWGASSFVAAGLRFTTGGGSLAVTLSAGQFVYLGRKYHATADKLEAIVVQVNGVDAGNGDAFTLRASRDHYISIGPDTDDEAAISIEVRDVANGAAAPAVPTGHFVFAVLVTNGSGVTATYYRAFPRVMQPSGSYGIEVSDPDTINSIGRLLPTSGSMDLGWNLSPDDAVSGEATSAGRFFGTVFHRQQHRRSYTTAGRLRDRSTVGPDYTTTTVGNETSNVNIFDLSTLPDRSVVLFTVEVVAESDQDAYYSRTIKRMGFRNSASAVGLTGADSYSDTLDPSTIGCAATITISGNNVRVRCAGAVGHDITWRIDVRTNEIRGATL